MYRHDVISDCCSIIAECEDLLRHMLIINPNKRISIQEIINHRWLREGEPDDEFNELVGESLNATANDAEVFNDTVLCHMNSLGLDIEEVKEVL